MLAFGFALIILVGGLLLTLPVANRNGVGIPFLSALFTSASATCVTGLVLYDTWTQFSALGQLIILLLIQIGGLGFMTVAILFSFAIGRRIGLRERSLLAETISSMQVGGVVRLVRRTLIGTAFFEIIGAILLSLRFIPLFGMRKGIWLAVFHSVSAFCNAGFDLIGIRAPSSSLITFYDDPLVVLTIAVLIVIGGVGFVVWNDLVESRFCPMKLRLHTRAVLASTLILLISGIMVFLLSVLFAAVLTSSRIWAVSSALLCALLFNYLFTEPRFSFFIYSTNDLMLLLFFSGTGIVSGTVASRLQSEKKLASQNERTAKILYQIASGFLSVSGRESLLNKAEALVREHTGMNCSIHLGQKDTGKGFEINGGTGTLGILELEDGKPEGQKLLIIQAVSTQLGIAMEREALVADREKIRLAMEREQQRGMLLRSVAHDLRSPLTALSGAGTLLADRYDELTDSERRKLAVNISEEMVWLSDLVENVLSMTRISERKIVLHKQDEVIDDVITEAVKHTERLLRERNFQVILPDEVVTAPMDGKLISQVVINLLDNAVRHTPPDSDIKLMIEAGKILTISVADTGDGIPAEICSQLFDRFAPQDNDIVDGHHGMGLGLSICKTIVEAHGGTLTVSDNSPKGSILSFTIPMEE